MSSSASASASASDTGEDPYLYLEEVESEKSLAFARAANDKCLQALGDPSNTSTYSRILNVLESQDRIPYVRKYGKDGSNNDVVLFNLWKDAENPKGLWRKTTLSSYATDAPEWTTVLDLDALGAQEGVSWVWKGSRPLPRRRDGAGTGDMVTRSLLSLSRGGSDAVEVREFDVTTGDWVTQQPFGLPEAKSRISYKSRNVVLVGTHVAGGGDDLTDSGYPRTVREWRRGTPLEEAPIVFEGLKTDVSVGSYLDDQRHVHDGPIYEVRQRSITFYTSEFWVRTVEYKEEEIVASSPDFVQLKVPADAEIDFVGHWLLVSLRSDWTVGSDTFPMGSLLYVPFADFVKKDRAEGTAAKWTILFRPTDSTALETYCVTKNFLVLQLLNHVKTQIQVHSLQSPETITLVHETPPSIESISLGAVDATENDDIWYTVSGYTQPSTLSLAQISVDSDGGWLQNVQPLKALPAQYNASNLVTEQGMCTSKDGTQIPYFVVRPDSSTQVVRPTLLYGYGGFEISLGPHYVAGPGIAWLERGGVYVEANIRGGGEYGPKWHQAALQEHRHKAFEDFIAVAEHLIATGVCTSETLGIRGGSNGGLLVGNMYTMRPDLWGAIHCAVPLLDMKRFHILLAGASWMAEFGNPDSNDWDQFLHRYSPLHNLDATRTYPPLLVTTSTRDDRVHPGHARKFVKKLWDELGLDNVFYYENIEGGHGGAADAKQSAFMSALAYDFMWETLSKNLEEKKKKKDEQG